MDQKYYRINYKCLQPIFGPTSPTNPNWQRVNILNFCVFYPICIEFFMGANAGQKII